MRGNSDAKLHYAHPRFLAAFCDSGNHAVRRNRQLPRQLPVLDTNSSLFSLGEELARYMHIHQRSPHGSEWSPQIKAAERRTAMAVGICVVGVLFALGFGFSRLRAHKNSGASVQKLLY